MTQAELERANLSAGRELVARLNDPATGGRYERWVERARGCKQPVRLRGASHDADGTTGEVVRVFSLEHEPDGVLLTPCGNRRASVCAPCSEIYRGDAWQLVAAGLRGGKGVPETVVTHPIVFATFTAPSFGPRAHDPRGWRQAARVSPAGSRRDLPARPLARLPQAPRGRRSVPGRGDLPGLL